jgi:hypothetical protein
MSNKTVIKRSSNRTTSLTPKLGKMRDVAQAANISKEAAKQIFVNALLDIFQNKNLTGPVCIAALRLWADIFGLNASSRLSLGDPAGKPSKPAAVAPVVQFIYPDNGRRPSVTRPAQIAERDKINRQ